MTKRLSQLTEDMANEQIISDALKLRSHLCLGNYLVKTQKKLRKLTLFRHFSAFTSAQVRT